MKVLVTGGSGYVGQTVVAEIARGHEVTVLDVKRPADRRLRFIECSILDLAAMTRAARGFEAVVHLAAIRHPLSDPAQRVFRVNTMGTYNALEAAARAGAKRFVFCSSDSTLGFVFMLREHLPDYLPIDEEHPLRPQDPYGLSKMLGEEICRAFTSGYGIETICLRPSYVWSAEIIDEVRALAEGPEHWPRLLWTYNDARDVAQAFRLAVERPGLPPHDVFFISADDNGTSRPSRELIREYLPALARFAPKFRGRATLLSNAKAKRVLGYRPQHSWREYFEK
jgi:UDP-glucose 4-epimerase